MKTGTRRVDKCQYPIFNGFVPKDFGQGIPSPGTWVSSGGQ